MLNFRFRACKSTKHSINFCQKAFSKKLSTDEYWQNEVDNFLKCCLSIKVGLANPELKRFRAKGEYWLVDLKS